VLIVFSVCTAFIVEAYMDVRTTHAHTRHQSEQQGAGAMN
jgi:hypothetical protein